MQNHSTTKDKQVALTERRLIERWQSDGISHRQIAALLGKAPQTINNEIKRSFVRQQVRKGRFEKVYRADAAQVVYDKNRTKSVRPVTLTKELKERIVHYWRQKYSPEMMGMAKGIPVPIPTIYYWIHHRHLGVAPSGMLYPRKSKAEKKQASPNFKPAGKSIEERPESTISVKI